MGENTDRILRMFARFVSVGYAVYLPMLLPSILAWSPRMAGWWTPVMAVAVFGSGLVPGLLSLGGPIRAVRAAAGVAAVVYLIAVCTWPLAWNGAEIPRHDAVWLASFPGLGAMAAVVAWPGGVALAHMVIGCAGVQLIGVVSRENVSAGAFAPEFSFAVMFCSLFVGGAIMALRAGRLLDSTSAETNAVAAAAASAQARTVERDRFAALMHDHVMSTLLAAARGGPHVGLRGQASATLEVFDEIRNGEPSGRPFTAEEMVVHLRAAAANASDRTGFHVQGPESLPDVVLPGESVRVVGAALAEALRNSVRHAGPNANRRVVVDLRETGVAIEIIDDGVGFARQAVPNHRLGIAVSILGRMNNLPGGSAQIESSPGAGTTVRLGLEFDRAVQPA